MSASNTSNKSRKTTILQSPSNQRFALPLIALLKVYEESRKPWLDKVNQINETISKIQPQTTLVRQFSELSSNIQVAANVSRKLSKISNYNYDPTRLVQYFDTNLQTEQAKQYLELAATFLKEQNVETITASDAKSYIDTINNAIEDKSIKGKNATFDVECVETNREKTAIEAVETKKNTEIIDRTLHHYTSFDAGIKILKSCILRACSVHGMNDPNEMITHDYKDDSKTEQQVDSLNDRLNFFSISFSLKGDFLPLWQAYSNDATGLLLKFELDDTTNETNLAFIENFKVEYLSRNLLNSKSTSSIVDSLRSKMDAYSFEDEHRLVVNIANQWDLVQVDDTDPKAINHRPYFPILIKNLTTPYVELEKFHLVLSEVMLGPKVRSEKMMVLLTKIVRQYYGDSVKISCSNVDYR